MEPTNNPQATNPLEEQPQEKPTPVSQTPDTTQPTYQPSEPSAPTTPQPRQTDLQNYKFEDEPTPVVHSPGIEVRPMVDEPAPSQTMSKPDVPVVTPQSQIPADPMAAPLPSPTTSVQVPQPAVQPENTWQQMQQPPHSSESMKPSAVPPSGRWRFGSNKKLKMIVIASAAVVVFGGSAAAYYFGYYMSPGVIWSQSLGNTAKGYDKLVGYLNTQSGVHYKGTSETGSFSIASTTNYDGSMSFKNDGTNGTGSMSLGLGVTRVDAQVRSIKAANASAADVYIQLNGIKGLGDSLGTAFGSKVDSLDGQWISIDHTFLEDLKSQVTQSTTKAPALTWSDISATAQSFGTVNKQYVFTTKQDKSVTTIVKKYGKEMVNGHKTYHYKIGFVKQNVKNYITALRDAFKQSKLGVYLQAQTGKSADELIGYTTLESDADRINSTDTIDVWSDTGTRMIYKVRVSDTTNPAVNYADLGLNYKGGDSFPFFVTAHSTDTSTTNDLSLLATLDTKANSFTVHVSYKTAGSGTSPVTVTGDFTFKPSNDSVSVTVPTGAKTLSEVLSELGLSDLFNAALMNSMSATTGRTMSSMSMGSTL